MSNITGTDFNQALGIISQLVQEHGADKTMQIIDCANGVKLALEMFGPDIGKATLKFMFDLATEELQKQEVAP